MNETQEAGELAQHLAGMDRREVVALLRHTACPFDLDFTDEFLTSLSLDQLRHLVMAAKLHELPTGARG